MLQKTGLTRTRALGFSLVEVMVAALIGLIGSIVIFQVYAVSERQKRTTTGGADAAQGGLLALYSIERDARMSGYGINYLPLLGCDVLAYDSLTGRDPIPAFKLVAARITNGAGGAPDSVTFMYGDSALSVSPVRLNSASNAGSTVHKVNVRFGFNVNDLIVVGQSGSPATACTMQQVTRLPDPPEPTENVEHTETVRYNKSTIAGQPNYSSWSNTNQNGGVVYNIGPSPSVIIYSISNGQLTHQSLLTSAASTVIMDGIVQLQAEYGKDTTGTADGIVDVYDTTEPASTDEWSRVLALRIAIVARSAEFDKTHCNANPQWTSRASGAPVATNFLMTNVDGTADSFGGGLACAPGAEPANPNPNNWRQYRYRVFETTVPLRNHIWFPQ
jgi:type IV pilus assembly protein PilW